MALSMRRIFLMVTAALVMAAMMVAMAMPAFAGGGGTKDPCRGTTYPNFECSGGGGAGGGGQGSGGGGRTSADLLQGDQSSSGGYGGGGSGTGGGSGYHCTSSDFGPFECHGRNL
jgi:hypothetical protein